MSKTTVSIHGKEYETVASRVSRFKTSHPDLCIVTKLIDHDDNKVIMRAAIKTRDGIELATGHAEESRESSQINKTSALENCETSAIGRALAAFGMAGTEFASADEVANAISQQGSKLTGMATDKQKQTVSKMLSTAGISLEEQPGYMIETFGVEIPLTKEGASFVISELISQQEYAP